MTIVVLIILATVSINAVLGENVIIAKAQKAKEVYEQSSKREGKVINSVIDKYGSLLDGNEYKDSVLQTPPKVTEGMTRVKYNAETQKWEKVEKGDSSWYNYAEKQWANVVLGDASWESDGKSLDETKAYTQLVWIPRYAYKITSGYHSNVVGEIDIKFINEENKGSDGTKYETTWPGATSTAMNDYVVHPAFEYNGHHLAGFWVGKFETSNTECNATDESTGRAAYTGNEVLTIRANVTSWRNLTIDNMYTICVNMNKESNVYGLSTNDGTEVDPHMMKNDEWGVVAYLSKSTTYGKGAEEVYINNNSNYITGIAGSSASESESTGTTNSYKTVAGQKASTSGTVWGVYDMSGGAYDRVAAYVNNGHGNLTQYSSKLVNGASYYKNVYEASVQGDSSDTNEDNYVLSTPEKGHYGDAVYETSNSSYSSFGSWNGDCSFFPCDLAPVFIRGGVCREKTCAGVFYFGLSRGNVNEDVTFRVAVPVL